MDKEGVCALRRTEIDGAIDRQHLELFVLVERISPGIVSASPEFSFCLPVVSRGEMRVCTSLPPGCQGRGILREVKVQICIQKCFKRFYGVWWLSFYVRSMLNTVVRI